MVQKSQGQPPFDLYETMHIIKGNWPYQLVSRISETTTVLIAY